MPTDKKISELTAAAGIQASDISVLVNGGIDYSYSFQTLLQFLGTNLATGAAVSFGTVTPSNITGKNGDLFIKTTTGQFIQKISGTWTIVFTVPLSGAGDGTVLYGAGDPGSGTGKDSDSYINTLNGNFFLKSGGSWAQVFSMATGPQGVKGDKGDTGAAGANGKTILSGPSNPSNISTGTDGDFYYNTGTSAFFGPKASGVWPPGFSLYAYTPAELPVTSGTPLTAIGGSYAYIIDLTLYPQFGTTPTILVETSVGFNFVSYKITGTSVAVYLPDFDSSNLTTQPYTIIIKA